MGLPRLPILSDFMTGSVQTKIREIKLTGFISRDGVAWQKFALVWTLVS
jgi:hypothetical protein